ncbi:MAG: restriction endonuclease subunit S [Acidimicrobiia bacterium]|nr:restriction endonuclease subunit S [Acidimicrobiia bacterium]
MTWQRRRLKHLAAIRVSNVDKKAANDEIPVRLVNYTDVYYHDRLSPDMGLMSASASAGQAAAFRLYEGDVVITKDSETPDDIGVASFVDQAADDMVCGYHLAVLRPLADAIDGHYLFWAMSSDVARKQLSAGATGVTRFGLRLDVIGSVELPAPPLHAQRAIADFLDAETARIDALIAKKRRMIELLEERWERLVLDTVSGRWLGSSVRWTLDVPPGFGELPDHWPVRTVWTLFRSGRGRVLSHEEIAANPGPYPVYSSQTANDGRMGSIDSFDFDGEYLTWTTDGANAGTVFHRTGKFNCTNVCGTLQASEDLDYRFMRHALSVATRWFVRQDINPKLMNDVMLSIRVPAPRVEVQRQAADRIESEATARAAVWGLLENQLGLLAERRQALITAAVTGELDVAESIAEEAS